MPDPGKMAEIRRAGAHERMVGIALGANGLGLPFGHPAYHPIYEAASEMKLPILIQVGLDLGFFLGGVVVIEDVFSWPGIGKLAVDSIAHADVPLIMGTVLFATLTIVLANLAVDLLHAVVDPRIRY